jgi:hypothetical protein
MVRKKAAGIVLSALVISVILCVYASAITGSLDNGRMILRVHPGDTIERSVRVNNVNAVPLKIELFASGDLANSTKILDNNFTLKAGESKDARFEMKVKGNGSFSTLINVKFTPDTGSGVGLSAAIIAISSGSADDSDTGDTPSDNPGTTDNTNTGNTSSDNPGNLGSNNSNLRLSLSPMAIVGIFTFALLVIFLILLMILYKKSKKVIKVTKVVRKRADRSS